MYDIDTIFHLEDDKLIIERKQDVQPILDSVQKHREIMTGKPVPGLGYYAGTLPAWLIEDYLNKTGITYEEFMQDNTHIHRILNNPDYAKFRVWEGKV